MTSTTTEDEREHIGEVPAPEPRVSAWRSWTAGHDLLPWLFAAGSVVVGVLFLATSLAYNQGKLIPPLDDAYIHLQYGRQLGEGHFFQYNTGDPISTGASSLLYAFVLALGWVLGFHGTLFLGWAVLVGVVCFALTSAATYLLGRELGGRSVGAWAGGLTAVSGGLAWGATSGMEVALVAALLMGSVLAVAREMPSARFRRAPVLIALLALVRPEGLIMAIALVGAMVWTVRTTRPRMVTSVVPALLPLLAGGAQLVFYRIATGTFRANGIQAKSWFALGYPFPTEHLDRIASAVQAILSVLLGTTGSDLLPPGGVLLVLAGLIGFAVACPRWRVLSVAVGTGLGLILLSLSTLITALWQDGRYLQPLLPLLWLLLVAGVHLVAGLVPDARHRRITTTTVLVIALLFSLSVLPSWALRLGQQAATIREAPVSVANWLRGNVPPGARIAVNDVGATAYFADHPVVDLVGLTTNGLAEPANQGSGALFEALRELPPDQRPTWFSIYDVWGGPPVFELADSGLLGDEPVQVFSLRAPARTFGALSPTCQSDRSCDKVNVWRADWTVAGTGDRPDRPVPGTLRDYVNVGSLSDEARHGYRPRPSVVGVQPTTVLGRTREGAVPRIGDSGRTIVGGETFTLSGLRPGVPVTVTGRIKTREPAADATVGGRETAVTVGGRPLGAWRFETGRGPWTQEQFVIPADAVTEPEITVDLGPQQPLLAPFPEYTSYGYWASQ